MAAPKVQARPFIRPVPDNAQEFIDRLKGRVQAVDNEVAYINSVVDSKRKLIDDLNRQYDIIRDYWLEIKDTNNLSEDMIRLLRRTLRHSRRVARISRWGLKAVKSLVIDIKSMYEATVITRDLVQDLVTRIDLLHDPGLDPKASIYGLLNEFKKQVNTSVDKTVEAVNATLKVLKGMEILDNALRDRQNGIRYQLRTMLKHLRTGKKSGLEDKDIPEYGPIPTFPLSDRDGDYYDRLKVRAQRFERILNDLTLDIQVLEDDKVRLDSKKNTIKKGLEAAEEASKNSKP